MTARRIFVSELMFWLVLGAVCLYSLYPLKDVVNAQGQIISKGALKFGSDLVGGTYLTLEVHTQEAVDAELVSKMQTVDEKLKHLGKVVPVNKVIENSAIKLSFASTQDAQAAADALKQEKDLNQTVRDSVLLLSFPEDIVKHIKEDAVQRNIEVLRARLDRFSVAEIPISAQGEKNIIVELPDVANPQQAKAMIGKAAQLDFRIVERFALNKDDILYELEGELPADKEILPGADEHKGFYLVEKYSDLTGKLLADAKAGFGGEMGSKPVVHFKFNDEGSEKFYALTSRHYGKQLAIVLDGVIISAPLIKQAIHGEGYIEGSGFNAENTRELALLLKSGSFVARVSFEFERQIGPSLGSESRYNGLMSCLVGLGLLFLFSVYYYSLSGLFAFLALVYNMILILFGLSLLGATLTLPGIGGMVLTVGMAIDASVLIFERIKEELKEGLSIKKSVSLGFSDAMTVIIDGNLTTFIVGLVLYSFGTGPVKGFAITMMLGIGATLITGLFFLRSLFKFYLDNFHVQKLKI